MPEQGDKDRQQLSRAAYDRLTAELDELTTNGRKQIAERLQRARELGDLSENAEYHETKNQQGMMEARIRKLEHIVKNADVIEGPVTSDTAVAGTIVTLRPTDGGEDETYLLAQSNEERADGIFTVTLASPLGQALTGKRVGDPVEWKGPKDVTFRCELVKLEPWEG